MRHDCRRHAARQQYRGRPVRLRQRYVAHLDDPAEALVFGMGVDAIARVAPGGPARAYCLARYAARNICTALSATSSMRADEGAGSAWKTKGRNRPAWHTIMNCEAANRQSGITRSPNSTRASR